MYEFQYLLDDSMAYIFTHSNSVGVFNRNEMRKKEEGRKESIMYC